MYQRGVFMHQKGVSPYLHPTFLTPTTLYSKSPTRKARSCIMITTTELKPSQIENIPAQLPPLRNEVISIEGGVEDDCKITFKCNNKYFVILLSIQSPVDSIERDYLERLKCPLISGDEEKTERIFEELIDLLAGLCQPMFRKYAAIASEPRHPRPTLYNLLYLEVLLLHLNTIEGTAVLHLQHGPLVSSPKSFRNENLKLPIFKSSEIEILDILQRDTVFRVLIEGSIRCAKVIGHQKSTKSIQREISSMEQISAAELCPRVHTPTLLGFISSEDDLALTLGFFMEYVEPGPPLLSLEIDLIPRMKRAAWAKQISDDLKKLHGIGLIWGDAKAGNIILDKESNPWIIDFGGGYTDNWVDAALADTVMGDLQGLRQIMKFLQVPDQYHQTYSGP